MLKKEFSFCYSKRERGVSEALAVQLWEDTKLIADGICHLYAGFSVGASLRVLTFQSCG